MINDKRCTFVFIDSGYIIAGGCTCSPSSVTYEFTLRWLWVLILSLHQWTPTHAAVFKGGVNKTVKCNNYLWSVLRKNGLDVSCLWHTTEWTQKVLNDAVVWIYVMMFVLEPIHMLANLTTYTYHNQSMAWQITYTIEACISQSICNDLCWLCHGVSEVDCYVCIMKWPVISHHGQGAGLNPRDDIMYKSLYTL